ncbi:ribonuclease T2 family protein [Nevskia soli]|uniref:ribonuclease T2 family protein n=1 Tax=Nevskia soli TaxID=418856 RepID=UPI0014704B74|nr:ribonuclease T2 [Nevskia soli]
MSLFRFFPFASLWFGAKRLFAFGVVALATSTAHADQSGRFDYYLLSLSWSPQYCAGSHRDDGLQCSRPYAFVAHGLWPQNERGYPQDCGGRERVGDDTIARMLPLMPSRGLIIHEWRSHGACSGLGADDYFDTVTRAYRSVRIPETYRSLDHYLTVDPAQLKRDFVGANPGLREADLAVQCSGHYLQEVRVCLTRELSPRTCGSDVRDECGGSTVLRPVR